jgi:hypothetical protein
MIQDEINCASERAWILLGDRLGDNNQLVALAEGLGLPYEAKQMRYNKLGKLSFLRGKRLLYVSRKARRSLAPPWPDVVMGLGYASMHVARYIRGRSGGKTRIVHLGNPRTELSNLDLVLTTPQYSLGDAPNVVVLPLPIGNPARTATITAEERMWLRQFPAPRRLVAVGGSTRQWTIDVPDLERTVRQLQAERDRDGGSVIVAVSPRTQLTITSALDAILTGGTDARVSNFPRFATLLAECDRFYVTADSVSMLAEAILTGKPVAMIPIKRSLRGRAGQWLQRNIWNFRSNSDLSQFWDYLQANKLVGSVEAPVVSKVEDSTGTAVSAVRRMLRDAAAG